MLPALQWPRRPRRISPRRPLGGRHIEALSLIAKAWALVAWIRSTPVVAIESSAAHAPAAPSTTALKVSGPGTAAMDASGKSTAAVNDPGPSDGSLAPRINAAQEAEGGTARVYSLLAGSFASHYNPALQPMGLIAKVITDADSKQLLRILAKALESFTDITQVRRFCFSTDRPEAYRAISSSCRINMATQKSTLDQHSGHKPGVHPWEYIFRSGNDDCSSAVRRAASQS